MKIGINALSITPHSTGGGTTYIVELLNHISQIDRHNNYVLFIRDDSKHHFDVLPSLGGTRFEYFSIPVPSRLSVVFRILIEQLLMPLLAWMLKLDVLFCPGDSIPLHCPCPSVMVIQNLIYFHFHEASTLLHRKKRRFHVKAQFWYYSRITRRSAIKADKIITVSENAKKEIIEYLKIDSSKISVVYHGLGSHFRKTAVSKFESFNLEPGYILHVGAIVPHKNIETLIIALSILKDRYSMIYRLVVAGADHAGYSSYLRSVGSNLGVLDQMTFLGHVPYKELTALYSNAKLFAILSLCESFGLPILEAMACGCPVISSNASSLPEIADGAAILVDPKDPINVANAMRSLIEDENLRNRKIIAGKNRAEEFTWDRAASQTISVINQVSKTH